MISMSGQVRLRRDGVTGTIVLDHPARLNALTPGMLAGIREGLNDFHTDSRVRVVVLTGGGDSFCSGTDLNTIVRPASPESAPDDLPDDIELLQEVVEQLLRYPKPLIAAVHGWVIGSGLTLAASCDLIIASGDARFWLAESRLGLSPAMSVPLLVWRLGGARAAAMLMGGDPVDGEEARRIGLVHDLQPPDLVWARANALAGQIANHASGSLLLTRRMLYETAGEPVFTQLGVGAAYMAAARTTAAAAEGIRAFLEKSNKGQTRS